MPQQIYIKDYDTTVNIPDDADMNQVQAALKKQFPPKQPQGRTLEASTGKPWVRQVLGGVKTALPYAQSALSGPQTQLGGGGEGDYSPLAQNVMRLSGAQPAAPLRNLPEAVPQMPLASRFGPVMGTGAALAQPAIEALGLKPTKPLPEKSLGYMAAGMIGPGGEEGLASKALDKAIDKGIAKGIRPSAVGINDYRGFKNYLTRARDAVKTIFANKENLDLTNEFGEKTSKLPETLDQFSQAVAQTKANIFKQYDAMAKSAGQAGAKVELEPIAKEFDKVAANKVIGFNHPEIVDMAREEAAQLRGAKSWNPEETQSIISDLNSQTKAFEGNPNLSEVKKAQYLALKNNLLRKGLDDAIEKGPAGPGYQALKNKYGALKTIEKDVAHRAIVDARKNNKQLIDFSDIGSAAELGRGLMTMNPATIGSAGIIKAMAAWIKHQNSPNTAIKSMFSAFEGGGGSIGKNIGMGATQLSGQRVGQSAQVSPTEASKVRQTLDPASTAAAEDGVRQSIIPTSGTVASDLVNTATANYLKGDYTQAINGFRQAMKADPQRSKYYAQQINLILAERQGKQQRGID